MVHGSDSKTSKGQADRKRHGLSNTVSHPINGTNPHVNGIAFDCTVSKNGKALNSKTQPSKAVQEVAKKCGLKNDIPGDYVHFLLKS